MNVEPVDPRDADWEVGPTVDYCVVFWSDRGEASEYDALGAEDVHAVIAWADAEARSRGATYALYAKLREGLVWLAGVDPTSTNRPNFTGVIRSGDIPAHWPRQA